MHKFLLVTLLFVAIKSTYANSDSVDNIRIVSLTPSITSILYQIGADDLIVGCTNYCTDALKDNKDVVASAVTVNLEKILILKPTLIFCSTLTKPETVEKLRGFGIEVKQLHTPTSFEEICKHTLILGKETDRESNAIKVVNECRKRVKEIQEENSNNIERTIFIQIGMKPIFVVLENTFMDDYITLLGGKNPFSDLLAGTVTRESVLIKNPEVIFIVTMGIVGEDVKDTWLKYPTLNAAKSGQIYTIDSEIACIPSPRTFVNALETMSNLLKQ